MPKAKRRKNPLTRLLESKETTELKQELRELAKNIDSIEKLDAVKTALKTHSQFLAKHPKTNDILRSAYLKAIELQVYASINANKLDEVKDFISSWYQDNENFKYLKEDPELKSELEAAAKKYAEALTGFNKLNQEDDVIEARTNVRAQTPPQTNSSPTSSPSTPITDKERLAKLDAVNAELQMRELKQAMRELHQPPKSLANEFAELIKAEKLSQDDLKNIFLKAEMLVAQSTKSGASDVAIMALNHAINQIAKMQGNLSPQNSHLAGLAHYNLAQLAAARGEHNQAITNFMSALKMLQNIPEDKRDLNLISTIASGLIEAHVDLASQAKKMNQRSEAIEHLQAALKILATKSMPSDNDLQTGNAIMLALNNYLHSSKNANETASISDALVNFSSKAAHLRNQDAIHKLFNRDNKSIATEYVNRTVITLVDLGRRNLYTNSDKTHNILLSAATIYKNTKPEIQNDTSLLNKLATALRTLQNVTQLLRTERQANQELEAMKQLQSTAVVAKGLTAGDEREAQKSLQKRSTVSTSSSTPNPTPTTTSPITSNENTPKDEKRTVRFTEPSKRR